MFFISLFIIMRLTPLQPTGGVILLHDTTPDEPKDLLELKVKKVKPATAVPVETPGESSRAGAGGAEEDEDFGPGYIVDDDEELAPVPADFEYETDAEDQAEGMEED
jgi:26S proteasome regulatory subunit N2